MYKRLIIALSFTLLCQTTFAERCPSIKDVKDHSLSGWKAYDSDDGTPLPAKRTAEFKELAEQLSLAEWIDDGHNRGVVHCYYRDKNGSDFEAYIAKDNFIPKNTSNYWYDVSGAMHSMHCAAGVNKCEFQSVPLQQQPQFAKK